MMSLDAPSASKTSGSPDNDRRRQTPLQCRRERRRGTGDQCLEGWTLYQYPGPGFAGIGDNSAEASYNTWVDRHNTLGLG
jgi:hypothetical protein